MSAPAFGMTSTRPVDDPALDVDGGYDATPSKPAGAAASTKRAATAADGAASPAHKPSEPAASVPGASVRPVLSASALRSVALTPTAAVHDRSAPAVVEVDPFSAYDAVFESAEYTSDGRGSDDDDNDGAGDPELGIETPTTHRSRGSRLMSALAGAFRRDSQRAADPIAPETPMPAGAARDRGTAAGAGAETAGTGRLAMEAKAEGAGSTAPDRVRPEVDLVRVWLVRHGERIDETAAGRAWMETAGSRYFDPPLTDEGRRQARAAGRRMQAVHDKVGFECVYVSPLTRTLQTAEEFAAELGLPSVVAPGLCQCAAAVKRRTYRKLPIWRSNKEVLAVAPRLKLAHRSQHHKVEYHNYMKTVRLLAEEAGRRGMSHIVCVTHREGIRDLTELTGKRIHKTPYCCSAEFGFQRSTGTWTLRRNPSDEPYDEAGNPFH